MSLANDGSHSLSLATFTNNPATVILMTEGIEASTVHVNSPSVSDDLVVPFGNVQDSGIGHEGGRYAMDEYTDME